MSKKYSVFHPALLTAIAALCLTGCQNTVNSVENADKNAVVNQIRDSRVITDRFLRDRLQLHSVRTARTEAGLLRVEVAATNARTGIFSQLWSVLTGENPYRFDYIFHWQDANGMTVPTPLSGWCTESLYPRETVFLQAVAPSVVCQDFILEVKESN